MKRGRKRIYPLPDDIPVDQAAAAARAAYQHEYYMTHREKAIEYHREYNRQHKKKQRINANYQLKHAATKKDFMRPEKKDCYTGSELMHSSPEKVAKAIEKIIAGAAIFVK